MASTRDKVLVFALSLPGATPDQPWGEDVVKVRGKIFVFVGTPGARRMTVKLVESHAHALTVEGAEPTGYGLGKHGWVSIRLGARPSARRWEEVEEWVRTSYTMVAPKTLARRVLEEDAGPSST